MKCTLDIRSTSLFIGITRSLWIVDGWTRSERWLNSTAWIPNPSGWKASGNRQASMTDRSPRLRLSPSRRLRR